MPTEVRNVALASNQGSRPITLLDVEDQPWRPTPDMQDLIDAVTPASDMEQSKRSTEAAKVWLVNYGETGSPAEASRCAGYSVGIYTYWIRAMPGFRAAYEYIKADVNGRWEAHYERKGLLGYAERYYNADGSLKNFRVREDPATMHRIMAAKMPEKYGNSEGGQTINIVINRTNE